MDLSFMDYLSGYDPEKVDPNPRKRLSPRAAGASRGNAIALPGIVATARSVTRAADRLERDHTQPTAGAGAGASLSVAGDSLTHGVDAESERALRLGERMASAAPAAAPPPLGGGGASHTSFPSLPELRRQQAQPDAGVRRAAPSAPINAVPWQMDREAAQPAVGAGEESPTLRALAQVRGERLEERAARPTLGRVAENAAGGFSDMLTAGYVRPAAARIASLHPDISYEEALLAERGMEEDETLTATPATQIARLAGGLAGGVAQYGALAKGARAFAASRPALQAAAATRAGQIAAQGGMMGALGGASYSPESLTPAQRLEHALLSAAQGATFGAVLPAGHAPEVAEGIEGFVRPSSRRAPGRSASRTARATAGAGRGVLPRLADDLLGTEREPDIAPVRDTNVFGVEPGTTTLPRREPTFDGVARSRPAEALGASSARPVRAAADVEPPYRGLSYEDVRDLPAHEIRASAEAERARERGAATDLFGAEGARRYNAAQQTANSFHAPRARQDEASRVIEEMEAGLTEAQRNRLFGIGETGYNADELREIADTAEFYSPENLADTDAEHMLGVIGRDLLTGKPDTDASHLIRTRESLRELMRRGHSWEDMLGAVARRARSDGLSVGDARDLLEDRLRRLGLHPETDRPALPGPSYGVRSPVAQSEPVGEAIASSARSVRAPEGRAEEQGERITGAVVNYRGRTYTAPKHTDAYGLIREEHPDFSVRDLFDSDEGFATSQRPFVGRAEALEIAQRAGQWNGRNRFKLEPDGRPGLFSEAVDELRDAHEALHSPAAAVPAPRSLVDRLVSPVRNETGATGDARALSAGGDADAEIVRVYHRTTPEAAAEIRRSGRFVSREAGNPVYVSTHAQGQAEGYGDAVVPLDIPRRLLELDDEFPTGELHYRILARDIRPEHFPAAADPSIRGASSLRPVTALAGAGIGAAGGAAADPEHPVRGALGGAVLGGALGGALPSALRAAARSENSPAAQVRFAEAGARAHMERVDADWHGRIRDLERRGASEFGPPEPGYRNWPVEVRERMEMAWKSWDEDAARANSEYHAIKDRNNPDAADRSLLSRATDSVRNDIGSTDPEGVRRAMRREDIPAAFRGGIPADLRGKPALQSAFIYGMEAGQDGVSGEMLLTRYAERSPELRAAQRGWNSTRPRERAGPRAAPEMRAIRLPDGTVVTGENHGIAVNNAVEGGLLPRDFDRVPHEEWPSHFDQGYVAASGDFVSRAPRGTQTVPNGGYVAEPVTGGRFKVWNPETGHVAEESVGGFDAQKTAQGIARRLSGPIRNEAGATGDVRTVRVYTPQGGIVAGLEHPDVARAEAALSALQDEVIAKYPGVPAHRFEATADPADLARLDALQEVYDSALEANRAQILNDFLQRQRESAGAAGGGNIGVQMMGGMTGGIGGAAYGATLGDTPAERAANALAFGAAGAAGGAGLGTAYSRAAAHAVPDALASVAEGIGTAGSRVARSGERGALGDPSAFYSRLDRSIDEFPQGRGTAQQWTAFLASRTAKGEREWVGIDAFLRDAAERGQPVTREQVRALYDQNAIQLQEVTKQGNVAASGVSGAAKFADYQTPGGSRYREVLVTLPRRPPTTRARPATARAADYGYEVFDEHGAPFGVYAAGDETEALALARDRGPTDFRREGTGADDYPSSSPEFVSPHWDEPNVLLHLRMNDRTLPNGEKVLFVEELQSDWHQQGRRQGYALDRASARAEIERLLERKDAIIRENGGLDMPAAAEEEFRGIGVRIGELTRRSIDGIPDAPFKRTEEWMGLGMKRVLDEAARGSGGSPAWHAVTQPQGVGEQLQHHLGRELASVTPLEVVDAAVLPTLKHDEIRRAVVEAIPVDVVDVLARHGFTAEQLVRQPDVVGKALPVNARAPVARGLAGALQLTGARLRAALYRELSPQAAGRNGELLGAVRASDLDPREVVGLLTSTRLNRGGGDLAHTGSGGARAGTEPAGAVPAQVQLAGEGAELSPAELAEALNRHDAILRGEPSNVVAKYVAPEPYTRISWATGAQQAERYDLSKHLDQLEWTPWPAAGEGHGVLVGRKGGEELIKETIPHSRLPDFVGKEAAERLVNAPPSAGGRQTLSGVDLRVGGEGMRSFYDRMIPNWIKDYGRRLGVSIDVEPLGLRTAGDQGVRVDALERYARIAPAEERDLLQRAIAARRAGQTEADFLGNLSPEDQSLARDIFSGVGGTTERVAVHNREVDADLTGNASFRMTDALRERIRQGQPIGAADNRLLRGVAGAGAGGAIGAATDDKNRLRGAATGAVAGAGLALAPEVLRSVRRVAGNDAGAADPALVGRMAKAGATTVGGAAAGTVLDKENHTRGAVEGGLAGAALGSGWLMRRGPVARSPLRQRAATAWKAGLLTALRTHEVNITSNVGLAVGETAKDAPAAMGDAVLSGVLNSRLGRKVTGIDASATRLTRTKGAGGSLPVLGGAVAGGAAGATQGNTPGERVRNAALGATAGATAALGATSWRGAKQGLRDAREVWAGRAPSTALGRFEVQETHFDNVLLDTAYRYVFRALGAEDAFFRSVAMERSLREQAQVIARNEGLQGARAREGADELYRLATTEGTDGADAGMRHHYEETLNGMRTRAIADAEVATFQDETHIGKALQTFGKIPVLGTVVAPFGKTPGAVGTRIVEYSPAGYVISGYHIAGLIGALKRGASPEEAAVLQRYASEAFGRATTGTSIIGLGYVLGRLGMATGEYPADQQEAKRWRQDGRQANSVLFGGRWLEYGRLAPLGNMLGIGASLAAHDHHGSALNLAADAGAATAGQMLDQTFIPSADNLMEAIRQRGKGGTVERYAQGLAGSVVPAAVASAARALDTTVRQPEPSAVPGIGSDLGAADAIRARLPGISRQVAPKVDPFGHDVQRPAANEVSPMRMSVDRRSNPLIKELDRLGIVVQPVKRASGESLPALRQRQRVVGQAYEAVLTDFVLGQQRDHPYYHQAADETEAQFTRRIDHLNDLRMDYQNAPADAAREFAADPKAWEGMTVEDYVRQTRVAVIKKVHTSLGTFYGPARNRATAVH